METVIYGIDYGRRDETVIATLNDGLLTIVARYPSPTPPLEAVKNKGGVFEVARSQ